MAPRTRTTTYFEGAIRPSLDMKDWTLDDNDLAQTCPLDNGNHDVEPEFDLGMLERLPLELLCSILVQADLRSLTDFRRVNQRAMQVIDSIPQYQTIAKHGFSALRGILSIETGDRISCQDLFRTLRTAECEDCGDFGGYVYLLTCSRVCFLCLSQEPKYVPLSFADAARRFGLTHNAVPALTTMRSIPGTYSPKKRSSQPRLKLVDSEAAYSAGIALHGSIKAMEKHVAKLRAEQFEMYRKKILQDTANCTPSHLCQLPEIIPFDRRSSNPRRFMAIVRAPWVDVSMGSLEYGFYCAGCEKEKGHRPKHWRIKYSKETFAAHIQQCGEVVNGKHC